MEFHKTINLIESRRMNLRETRVDSAENEVSIFNLDGSDEEGSQNANDE